jgi:hypothetical protein
MQHFNQGPFGFYHIFLKIFGNISTVFRSVGNLFHAIYVHFMVFDLLLTFIRILLIRSGLFV